MRVNNRAASPDTNYCEPSFTGTRFSTQVRWEGAVHDSFRARERKPSGIPAQYPPAESQRLPHAHRRNRDPSRMLTLPAAKEKKPLGIGFRRSLRDLEPRFQFKLTAAATRL